MNVSDGPACLFRLIGGSVLIAASLGSAFAAEPAPPAQRFTAGGEWEGYNKSLDGQRYSPLLRINSENAQELQEVCRVRIADRGSLQSGLVVVGDKLFVTIGSDTLSLDAATCKILWKHRYREHQSNAAPANRGVAYLNGRIFRGTADARLIALDAQSGSESWSSVVGDPGLGELISGAPLAWNGIVIVGIAGGEFGVRGRIVAFDAMTGRELWRFDTIPVGTDSGADTWKDSAWANHGGGGTWSTFALDPVASELFVPVGNPTPDFSATDRPGSNLYTDSVVILDALTGNLRWWYQITPHDAHDLDLGAAPVLYRNSAGEDLIALGSKDGFLHVVDRKSHQLRFKVPVTTVDTARQDPTPEGIKLCPGVVGGIEWNGPAFDPQHKTLFIGAVDYCAIVRSAQQPGWNPGGVTLGGSWAPTTEAATGWITAVDADTGAIRWKYHTEAPVVAGVTVTAGGIVMSGDNGGNFLVFNAASGKVLKRFPTGGAIAGGVVTYENGGSQYVAFTSGNISRGIFGTVGRPSIIVMALNPIAARAAAAPRLTGSAHGQEIYMHACVACHGVDGKNISGFDLRTINFRLNQEQLMTWIKNPAPPMPKIFPEPLEPNDITDIRDVATFLEQWR